MSWVYVKITVWVQVGSMRFDEIVTEEVFTTILLCLRTLRTTLYFTRHMKSRVLVNGQREVLVEQTHLWVVRVDRRP